MVADWTISRIPAKWSAGAMRHLESTLDLNCFHFGNSCFWHRGSNSVPAWFAGLIFQINQAIGRIAASAHVLD